MNCLKTLSVAGACQTCGEYQSEGMHIVTGRDTFIAGLFCEGCCPLHKPASFLAATVEVTTVTGTQEGLFG